MLRNFLIFISMGHVFGVTAEGTPTEILDWYGFEVHVFEVDRCGTTRDVLSNPDGYLCFEADPPEYDGDSLQEGFLTLQIWLSDQGTVRRVGFWSGYDV